MSTTTITYTADDGREITYTYGHVYITFGDNAWHVDIDDRHSPSAIIDRMRGILEQTA